MIEKKRKRVTSKIGERGQRGKEKERREQENVTIITKNKFQIMNNADYSYVRYLTTIYLVNHIIFPFF